MEIQYNPIIVSRVISKMTSVKHKLRYDIAMLDQILAELKKQESADIHYEIGILQKKIDILQIETKKLELQTQGLEKIDRIYTKAEEDLAHFEMFSRMLVDAVSVEYKYTMLVSPMKLPDAHDLVDKYFTSSKL